MRPAVRASLVLLLAALLATGCSAIKKLNPWREPTTTLASVRVAAPPGANLDSATALDLVFVYDKNSIALLPKTGPEWFAQKQALINGLGKTVDVVPLQVPPATVVDPVPLPKRASNALAVYGFANYLSGDGQARLDITQYRRAVIWLAATQIQLSEGR
jgi:type VI secretion system protein